MVGLIITLSIIWFVSFAIGTLMLALYESSIGDEDIHPIRLVVLLIPVINTMYFVYIIYKILQKDNISKLKL
jgi:hypothetical protein